MSVQVIQQSSYNLTLSEPERNGLLALLQHALGGARVEAHRTHTPDFRDQVLKSESIIRSLIEKVQRCCPDQVGASSGNATGPEEASVIDSLFIDDEGRFQMAATDLDNFIRFLRDHEVRVDVKTADTFRSGGETYGYGRLLHPYDADSVTALYRTWRETQMSLAVVATA